MVLDNAGIDTFSQSLGINVLQKNAILKLTLLASGGDEQSNRNKISLLFLILEATIMFITKQKPNS